MEEQRTPHWQQLKLGNAITLQRGKDLPVQERLPGPFPVIGSSGIVGYHVHFVAKGPGAVSYTHLSDCDYGFHLCIRNASDNCVSGKNGVMSV